MASKTSKVVAELLGDAPPARSGLPQHMLTYDRESVFEDLLSWVARGKPITKFCAKPHNPSYRTVTKWMDADPKMQAAFDAAREMGCDMLAGECLDIADDRDRLDKDDVKNRALRIKTRMDLIGKWSHRYGAKVQLADADGGKLPLARSDSEIMEEIRGIMGVGMSRLLAAENRIADN